MNVFANTLISDPAQNVKTGDIVSVEIRSELGNADLRSYVHKKIEHNVYVMKFFEENKKRYYSLFISELPKKLDDSDAMADDFIFKFQGLKIKNTKSKDNSDFKAISIKSDFKLNESKNLYLIISGIISLIIALLWGFNFLQKKKTLKREKQKREERANVLIELLRGAKTREELESIYYRKNEIRELVDCNESVLEEYYGQLNRVQFCKDWTNNEEQSLREILNKFGIMKVRGGI